MQSMPILLLDGGLGTCLESAPYDVHFSSDTPLWSSHLLASSPKTLLEVHKAYAAAGADVLLTATYQASYEGFAATPRNAAALLLFAKGQDDGSLKDQSGNTAEKQTYSRFSGIGCPELGSLRCYDAAEYRVLWGIHT